eukprot:scaffold922_cov327-Pinguiococcus_pyrenoidosus.AAC.33
MLRQLLGGRGQRKHLGRWLSTSDWSYDVDVLVVGGGIVGAAVAADLAASSEGTGLRIGYEEARSRAQQHASSHLIRSVVLFAQDR